jgi:TfoX/Sxy family transcriptional regulator of competence genes
MAYDETLAHRIRALLAGTPGLAEKSLFGGLGFLVNGNLAVSAYRDGDLMIRAGQDDWQAFCAEDGARPMTRKGQTVSGWVIIAGTAVADDDSLRLWVKRGRDYAVAQTAPPS